MLRTTSILNKNENDENQDEDQDEDQDELDTFELHLVDGASELVIHVLPIHMLPMDKKIVLRIKYVVI